MGCTHNTPHFVILVFKNIFNHPRLGLIVSSRVGNAVVRNNLKRRLKEYFRNNKQMFVNCDYLIIARQNAKDLRTNVIYKELSYFFETYRKAS